VRQQLSLCKYNNKCLTRWTSIRSSLNDGEDFFEQNGINKEETEAGEAMAREFYEQLRTREMESSEPTSSESDASSNNRVADTNEKEDLRPKGQKFTGRQGEIDSTGTPSAGLFARSNGSVYGYPVERARAGTTMSGRNPVQEQMMQSEYRLASLAGGERSILIQLALALTLLGAVLYVGISGGITDGSERLGLELDEFNEVTQNILDYGQSTTPQVDDVIRTSQTGSVWL